ncbi:hypothetical protein BH23ACT3_BH23ACT3_10840 [soil metagenome]
MSAAEWSIDEISGGGVVVAVRGDFDLAAERSFVDTVDSLVVDGDGEREVELDLAGVEFMDSSGVRALIELRHRHRSRIRLGELSEPVRALFVTAGVLEWLTGDDGAVGSDGDRR